ncbi:MAG: AGE family epimerase/isomerase [Bacteroidetes bacterium]|nr:AGE family epimerase/isomerase [Bacteroidota bacterium]
MMMNVNDFEQELARILDFWTHKAFDKERNYFYGRITSDNWVDRDAPLGVVLYARILWTFSSAYRHTRSPLHLERAARAYTLLNEFFHDDVYGGYYWSVTAEGVPIDTQKKVYALAFVLYGLCAYYEASHEKQVLEQAKALFKLIEERSYDPVHKGYLDAFQRDWQPGNDLRLSEKDEDAPKTMNTHLHVLEAYTALYRLWQDQLLCERLKELIGLFHKVIVHPVYFHLTLFFDVQWNKFSDALSFGHDIEASWLLTEAAGATGDAVLITDTARLAESIASAAAEGIALGGGLSYEYHPSTGKRDEDKHWWVQAEAVVGFYNAWQLTGNPFFLQTSDKLWQFVQQRLLDKERGEWYWGVHENGSVMKDEDKAGFWKCPYHNSRCCLEMIERLKPKHITQSTDPISLTL